jgi:hypothetical protein
MVTKKECKSPVIPGLPILVENHPFTVYLSYRGSNKPGVRSRGKWEAKDNYDYAGAEGTTLYQAIERWAKKAANKWRKYGARKGLSPIRDDDN